MTEYGIGRVPADVDTTKEALAEIEAARHMPRAEVIDCSNCGRPTYRSNLMNESLGTCCPTCWETDNDGDGYGR